MSQNKIHQFRITLKKSKPLIWRRIQVPTNFTFWELHCAIQDAMGWQDYHLHEFKFLKNRKLRDFYRIGIPDDSGFGMGTLPGWDIDMKTFFKEIGTKCTYDYDFGDNWEHTVELEKIISTEKDAEYPRCVAGKRACPPEDCGGLWGYYNLIEVMKNPEHERYDELSEWLNGTTLDPEAFDAQKIEFTDSKERLEQILKGN